jgi:hypothetical protein
MIFGFVVFGVDGSRVEVPRTKSHEAVNGLARKERAKNNFRSCYRLIG